MTAAAQMTAAARMTAFRDLHATGSPLVLPNAWDHASAAALVAAGFPAVGTTSLGVAACAGLPDGVGATRDATLGLVHRLAHLPCLLTVDLEGGFSDDPAEVAALAAEVAGAGAVGINLEDGRDNARLAPVAWQCEAIAAVKARVPTLFVNARTDTHWLGGADSGLAETLERVLAYRAAGADGVFVPGLVEEPDIAAVVDAVDVPVNILFQPDRHRVPVLAALGVRRISTGSLLFRAALHAATRTALAVAGDEGVASGLPGYREVQQLSRPASMS